MIRALVFDFDGLILDTETPEYEAWQAIYAEHGCVLDRQWWTRAIGLPWGAYDSYAQLEAQCGQVLDRVAIRARRQRHFFALLESLPPMPGIVDYLDAAQQHGLGVAVASSSPRHWVVDHLTRLGLLERFTCLRCAEDAPRAKPYPDLYLAAVAALGVAPQEAIALEDSPNGITAAKAAGLYCVAVPNAMTRDLALDHADRIIPSLADIALSDLLTQCA